MCLWLVILAFGLWPFNFRPLNKTNWLQDRNGIHFDRYGRALSATCRRPTANTGNRTDNHFSLEFWLLSDKDHTPVLSTFFRPAFEYGWNRPPIIGNERQPLFGSFF